MKNIAKICVVCYLFSAISGAQTKPDAAKNAKSKPPIKTAAKPAAKPNSKSNSKLTVKPAAKNSVAPNDKSRPKEKTAPTKQSATQNAKQSAPQNNKQTGQQNLKQNAAQKIKTSAPTAKSNSPKSSKPAVAIAKKVENPKPNAPAKSSEKAAAKPVNQPTVKPLTEKIVLPTAAKTFDQGELDGKIYTNKSLHFAIELPEEWIVPGADFEAQIKEQGINLALETPQAVKANAQKTLAQAANRVGILLTAYKISPDTAENAILRVSIEDLRAVPQVKDAVDYFDLMRQTFQIVKTSSDFKYSETGAERLGKMQFGFLDTSTAAGKKRMYATVRGGFALMFTLTYKSENDLETVKNVLANGNFRLK